MMDLDFSKIRVFNNSKNAAFEELICQLAYLQRPDTGSRFVKKEGAGGDAGVECYWSLDDGSEKCWQAKFFPEGVNSSRWQQINESFCTALNKHPNMTHYVICLPLDRSDSRKTGRGGKKVVTMQDEWEAKVDEWKSLALSLNRNVEISYWGKHEIINLLTIDDPLYSGKALFWFNEPFLTNRTFEKIAQKNRAILGERYSPEFNVDLPIAKSFDGLCLNKKWWALLGEKCSSIRSARSDFFLATNSLLAQSDSIFEPTQVRNLEEQTNAVYDGLHRAVTEQNIHVKKDFLVKELDALYKFYSSFYSEYYDKIDREFKSRLRKIDAVLEDFLGLLRSNDFLSSQTKSALLVGEAGIGKSHLLCDLSLGRIKEYLPTLFLLGGHYRGGNPIGLVKETLELGSFRNSEVLGALDAAGEASGERTLIVIDAINEGPYRQEWDNQIVGFLDELSNFDNIAIIMSCRSTYLNFMLPGELEDEILTKIEHYGFMGHEHRAAEQYLSRQGISKPSAPILAPEFSNPLFLKTCCKAIKQTGQSSFPKGLNSIASLFDFYISSIEKTIAKRKKYNPQEKIVKSTLFELADRLLPDNLYGLPINDARMLSNRFDPNPNVGEGLFNILLDEGLLAEDVSFREDPEGGLIVRFTYERFSDYLIAQRLIANVDSIEPQFEKGGAIYQLLVDKGYASLAGVFEALSIVVAEKFHRELQDLLPSEIKIGFWQLEETFKQTVLWRSAESFTERTLEILNSLRGRYQEVPIFEILLKLATEPSHPWNAELIHKNLAEKTLAERDHFWSINMANGYSSEEDEQYESSVRTLIEWAYSGELQTVEKERVRLCSIALIWLLTLPGRNIRDRATKALVRLLTFHPGLLNALLHKFKGVDDLYLQERLWAAAYGVICSVKDGTILREISNSAYALIFNCEEPVPHILLRDYARGILEYALHLNALSSEVNVEKSRPPYRFNTPLENPSLHDIEIIAGGEFRSQIRNSLMGFPGDFGNYTMRCIHHWSATPLSSYSIDTGIDIKLRFASDFLEGELKQDFLNTIVFSEKEQAKAPKQPHKNKLKMVDKSKVKADLFKNLSDKHAKKQEMNERVTADLAPDLKEYYRWLSGLADDKPAAFSRKWAQRWVCKRAHELGWKKELFEEYDRNCANSRSSRMGSHNLERVGKKYQWIALHEFLARLSDQFHWIGKSYSNDDNEEVFEGPWQIGKRDIDPTHWLREAGEHKTFYNKECTWWQPYTFPFPKSEEIADKVGFLWSKDNLPNFPELLTRKMSVDSAKWLVLHGFLSQNVSYGERGDDSEGLDGWFSINAIFIKKGNFESLSHSVPEMLLGDSDIINESSTLHEGFLGEYPWHSIYKEYSGWRNPTRTYGNQIELPHFVPITKYQWESGNNDRSIESSIDILMPAKELIDELGLVREAGSFGQWLCDGKPAFFDPSFEEYGPSYALMNPEVLERWLVKNDMEVVWLIGGEKQLITENRDEGGYLNFSGLYRYQNGEVNGRMWFHEERLRN